MSTMQNVELAPSPVVAATEAPPSPTLVYDRLRPELDRVMRSLPEFIHCRGAVPRCLPEMIAYALDGGGKQVRAALFLLACELVDYQDASPREQKQKDA